MAYIAERETKESEEDASQHLGGFAALKRALTPSKNTRKQIGLFTSLLAFIMDYFGGMSRRKIDIVVACLEDEDLIDEAKSYGDGCIQIDGADIIRSS